MLCCAVCVNMCVCVCVCECVCGGWGGSPTTIHRHNIAAPSTTTQVRGCGCPLRPRRHAMHARTVAVARRRVRVLTALRRLSACAGVFPTAGQQAQANDRRAEIGTRTCTTTQGHGRGQPQLTPALHTASLYLHLSIFLPLSLSLSLSLSKHTPHTARNTQTVFRAPEHATRLGGQRGGAPNVARGVSARKPAGCAAFNLRRRRPLCLAPIAPASNPCETETNSTKLSTEVQSQIKPNFHFYCKHLFSQLARNWFVGHSALARLAHWAAGHSASWMPRVSQFNSLIMITDSRPNPRRPRWVIQRRRIVLGESSLAQVIRPSRSRDETHVLRGRN